MAMLRVSVNCFTCKKVVSKTEARLLRTVAAVPHYECFSCFKKNKVPDGRTAVLSEKCELYCDKCRYKFLSNKLVCPYCNQSDFLSKGNPNVHDLMK